MTAASILPEIILPGVGLRLVEPGLYSAYPAGEGVNSYDNAGAMAFYDAVACNPVYNYLVWGYRTSLYATLCREILGSAKPGWILDAGCGSLAFTASTFVEWADKPVVLLDQSLTLLKKAKKRLIRNCGCLPDNVVLLHGDATRLPFQDHVFTAVMAFNLLHVLQDIPGFARELQRVRVNGAPLLLTTLVLADRLADRYLKMWGDAGELTPRRPQQLIQALTDASIAASCAVKGSLAVLRAGAWQTPAAT